MAREGDLIAQNLLVNTKRVIVEEWWIAGEQLECQDTKRPPIHGFSMTLRKDNLRSEIFRSTAKCERPILDLFGESEIGDPEVSHSVQKKILGFQISVDGIVAMQVLDGEDDGSEVEASDVCGETTGSPKVGE